MQDPKSPLSPATMPLGMLIVQARRHIKQALWSRLSNLDLTPPQFWIILAIHESDSLSLHDLALRISSDDPTTSRIVKTLMDKGMVESEPDPNHGRRIRLTLSKEGRRQAPDLKKLLGKLRKELENCLEPEEERILRQALGKIIQKLSIA